MIAIFSSPKISKIINSRAGDITGAVQGMAVAHILSEAHEHFAKYSQRRRYVIRISAIAWIFDTIDFYTDYVPVPGVKKIVACIMTAAYTFRAHVMMYWGMVGIVPDSSEY